MEELILVKPDPSYAEEIASYRREMLAANSSMDGCSSLRKIEDPLEWIKDVEDNSKKETCPPERAIADLFLYVRRADNRIVGMIQIRHELSNDYLKNFAGHIGYSVRPSERRKGYAKQMLKNTLLYCKEELGLDRVMISCIDTNEASRKTILCCGEKYDSTAYEPNKKVNIEKYRIEL